MSIIHSALKKVQSKQAASNSEVPLTPASATSTAEPLTTANAAAPTHPLAIIPLILIGLGLVLLILFIIWCLTMLPKKAAVLPSVVTTPAAAVITTANSTPSVTLSPVAIATAITANPTPESPVSQNVSANPFDSLDIEGTLDTGGGKVVALINGEIYEEGQTLFGKIIAEITTETITIMDNGNRRIIPTKETRN